jgi:hypothetical protein
MLAGMLLVFQELIGAILGLASINLAYSHMIALVLAAITIFMQWMRPGRANAVRL